MTRLPKPGSDEGNWGQLLNDFLAVEHNSDGSLKASGSLATKEPSISPGTLSQYLRGDKTWQNLDTDANLAANSDTRIPSQRAVKGYVDAQVTSGGTPDATASVKGKVLLAGDLAGTAGGPSVKSRQTLVVGSQIGQTADYMCTGTVDDILLQAAANALGSTYTKLYIQSGTYNVTQNIVITASNIEIELAPGAVIKAAQRTSTASKSEYMGIFFLRKTGSGSTQDNVYIHGGTVDCNNQAETSAVSIWGSGSSAGSVVTTTNIRIEDMVLKNKGSSTQSPALLQIHSVTDLNLGRVQNVFVRRCTFDTSDNEAVRFRGSYMKGLHFEKCEYKNIGKYTINHSGGSETGDIVRTTENVFIQDSYFHDTMLTDMATTVYDFGQASRIGIKTLVVSGNTFDSINEFNPNDNPNLQIYASHDVLIANNTFKNTRQAFSLGYSNNATVLFADPNQSITITNNDFFNVHSTLTDYDSNTRCTWDGNRFYRCGLNIFTAYSVHSHSVFQNNLVYNCQTSVEDAAAFALYNNSGVTPGTFPDKYKSCITIGGNNQYIVRGNVFVDDRKLNDPTGTPPQDASLVPGGSMGARTYYYRYVFQNASGQTNASPSQAVTIGSGKLLKITPTSDSGTNYRTANSLTLPVGVSGIEQILIYVGTAAGAETLQATIDYPDFTAQNNGWTESPNGLAAGSALPSSNTTHTLTKYGIYEDTVAGGYLGPNVFSNNIFMGIAQTNCIFLSSTSTSKSVVTGNVYLPDLSGASFQDPINPNINQLNDSNGNPWLSVNPTAGATGGLQITNNVAGSTVTVKNAAGGNAPTLFIGAGTGLFAFRPNNNAVDSWRVQSAGGSNNLISADTQNTRVAIGGITPLSTLDIRGSVSYKRTAVADTNYTVLATDYIVAYASLTAPRTVTLPTAASVSGRTYIIKDEVGVAATQTITVTATGVQTIDGSTTYNISENSGWVAVYSDGSNWQRIASSRGTSAPNATATAPGLVQLAGDLGGTATSPTTPTALHLTGAETVTGVKTFSANPNVMQINDANGNPWLKVNATASATGGFMVTNNVAGSTVTFANSNSGNSSTVFKGAGTGLIAIRPGNDSVDAFRLQNASGANNYFGFDSSNGRITVGGSGSQANSTLTVLGSISTPIATKSLNYTLTIGDATILASGNTTLTLPSAVGITGREYTIKKIDSAGTTILIATTASQSIDGNTNASLTNQYATIRVQSDGTQWWTV